MVQPHWANQWDWISIPPLLYTESGEWNILFSFSNHKEILFLWNGQKIYWWSWTVVKNYDCFSLSDSFLTLMIYLEIVPLGFPEPCQPLCSSTCHFYKIVLSGVLECWLFSPLCSLKRAETDILKAKWSAHISCILKFDKEHLCSTHMISRVRF